MLDTSRGALIAFFRSFGGLPFSGARAACMNNEGVRPGGEVAIVAQLLLARANQARRSAKTEGSERRDSGKHEKKAHFAGRNAVRSDGRSEK